MLHSITRYSGLINAIHWIWRICRHVIGQRVFLRAPGLGCALPSHGLPRKGGDGSTGGGRIQVRPELAHNLTSFHLIHSDEYMGSLRHMARIEEGRP